jgi:hypothetical protein
VFSGWRYVLWNIWGRIAALKNSLVIMENSEYLLPWP